jgi:hypothetical protein
MGVRVVSVSDTLIASMLEHGVKVLAAPDEPLSGVEVLAARHKNHRVELIVRHPSFDGPEKLLGRPSSWFDVARSWLPLFSVKPLR